ncbi:MAG TPA: tetratricopeptide repeat protein, partial [Legionellaceae bacterium]|nr:tetratricopeptide repeat protein [Legionellaceae bacterium]
MTPPPRPDIHVGRSKDLSDLVQHVLTDPHPRICIIGGGGFGKTTLACALIHEEPIKTIYKKNIFFISCETCLSVDHAWAELANVLFIKLSDGGNARDKTLEVINNESWTGLVVVDNFETLWDDTDQRHNCSQFLQDLSTGSQRLALILTMRASVFATGISWSKTLHLQVLQVPDAIDLYFQVSKRLQDDVSIVTKLVEAVECLPLAVQLFATQQDDPQNLLDYYEKERLNFLATAGSHRTNNLAISVQASLRSKRILQCSVALELLAIIATLPSGAAIDQLPDMVLEHIKPMLTRALHILQEITLVYRTGLRIKILAPIRELLMQYPDLSLPLLDQTQQVHIVSTTYHQPNERAVQQLRTHFLNILNHIYKYGTAEWLLGQDMIRMEFSNIEATLVAMLNPNNNEIESAIHLTCSFATFICISGLGSTRLLYDALRCAHQLKNIELQAKCLCSIGEIDRMRDNHKISLEHYKQALAMFQQIGDQRGQAQCLQSIGDVERMQDNYTDSVMHLEQALAMFQQIGDQRGQAQCLQSIGDVERMQDNYTD